MDISLKGRTAVVCGSTQGIGKAAALQLARQGAKTLLIARDASKLELICKELFELNGEAHTYLQADFSSSSDIEKAAGRLAKMNVHILINNTGGPPAGRAIDAGPDAYRRAFEMHLISNHVFARACIDSMKRMKYGRIINVISTSVKQPLPNLGVSNTIRGAVANWSKTLANELGQFGITVNNILPGATATGRLEEIVEKKARESGRSPAELIEEMGRAVPAGRVADPSEIANAIGFLASPAASYINGINLPVDGGRTSSL